MVSVYDYVIYRDYIRDYYKEQKKINSKFSYQSFANKAGFSTKTFIPKVIKGEKKLAQRSMSLIIKAMNLNKREATYFETIVNFNDAKDIYQKEYYLNYLHSLKKKSTIILNYIDEFHYFSKWYHVVVYELLSFIDWKGDYVILGKSVKPSITKIQARKAVELLIKLGLIKKESSGKYVQTGQMKLDSSFKSFAIKRFQESVLEMGVRILKRDYDKQCIQTITRGVSLSKLPFIIEEMEKFKKKIIEIVESSNLKEEVIQLNCQLFSVSNSKKVSKDD